MKLKAVVVFLLTVLFPALSWAGRPVRSLTESVPALDEAGLVMLGVALAGAGMALVRRGKR